MSSAWLFIGAAPLYMISNRYQKRNSAVILLQKKSMMHVEPMIGVNGV
jgi:hypothetical protein